MYYKQAFTTTYLHHIPYMKDKLHCNFTLIVQDIATLFLQSLGK